MQETVTVWAGVDLPGFHRWPGASGVRAYLADRHRHLFRIVVHVHVAHDDRDVEFHDLQDAIRAWWGPGSRECGSDSCEALARQLAVHLQTLGAQVVRVDVSEDGENGAVLTYEHPELRTPGYLPSASVAYPDHYEGPRPASSRTQFIGQPDGREGTRWFG